MEQSSKEPTRLLFVDDDPGILLTMPEILQQHGYQVTAAGSVNEALTEITSRAFDVLVSDLNIGHPADGYTVVSAMRRTQPNCVTLIVTGFPGFDSALESLRRQVDDYLVKPVPIPTLIALIEERLKTHKPIHVAVTKRVSQIIQENAFEIIQRTLKEMVSDPELGSLSLTDEQRIEDLPHVLTELATLLELSSPETLPATLRGAEQRGRKRYLLGYTVPLLATHVRLLGRAIHDVVHKNLSSVNLSFFMVELRQLNDSLGLQLEHTLKAYMDMMQQSELTRNSPGQQA